MTHATEAPERTAEAATGEPTATRIPQLTWVGILGVWAAAAIPMGVLAWLVAPRLADRLGGAEPLAPALLIALTVGLVWQFVLVVGLVRREQGTLRWSVVREALWLRSPRSPRTGRVGGRVWLVLFPLILLFAAQALIPSVPHPANRDLGLFIESDAGQAFFSGAWGWYALVIALLVFNTILGEELLFRGYLLPRMNGAFGRADWLVNGVLFSAYHVATPWVMPLVLLDALILSYPTKRYQSAWIGIAVHSAQSVVIAIALLPLVI